MIKKRFEAYHAENPWFYTLFKRFTRQIIKAGFQTYSAHGIAHRMRWHSDVEMGGEEKFKINDHYIAFYSRLFMSDYPQYDSFFHIRGKT